MGYKGQAELIIIVALMVVIVIVVATQINNIIPTTESPDIRNARESVESFIRAAVIDTLGNLSESGGYLSESDYQLGYVYFNDKKVPYWQYGGEVRYPDILENIRSGVDEYIKANKNGLAESLAGLSLGDAMVGTPVFSGDKLTLSVTMPTTYKETPVTQTYTVSVDSQIGDIYSFAKGIAAYDAANRPFEYYTLSTMMLSPMDNGHHAIPMYEILVGCGDYIFASSWDIMPEVEDSIRKTLAHVYMPGKVPEGTLRTSGSPKYSLVPISNNNYENLEVAFIIFQRKRF